MPLCPAIFCVPVVFDLNYAYGNFSLRFIFCSIFKRLSSSLEPSTLYDVQSGGFIPSEPPANNFGLITSLEASLNENTDSDPASQMTQALHS